MPFTARITVYPDVPPDRGGGFLPTSFTDLLHMRIELPGLDPAWTHTLVGVEVADDRSSAELTVHSEPTTPLSLDRHLRIADPMPPARIKAFGRDGTLLAHAHLPAPLQAGQLVTVGGRHYRVAAEPTWPHRDPDSGAVQGDTLDWQHVTLTPDDPPPHLPALHRDLGQ